MVYQLTKIQSLKKQIKELEKEIAELCVEGVSISQEKKSAQLVDPNQKSDKLSLPFEKAIAM